MIKFINTNKPDSNNYTKNFELIFNDNGNDLSIESYIDMFRLFLMALSFTSETANKIVYDEENILKRLDDREIVIKDYDSDCSE